MALQITYKADEYATVRGPVTTLFYTATPDTDDVVFDPAGDERLLELQTGDVADFPLQPGGTDLYKSLVMRASYECKLHPQQTRMRELVANELANDMPADELIVMLYRRDSAARSDVTLRRQNPFRNAYNGVESAEPASVILFEKYTFEPKFLGTLVWHTEPRLNSTLGTIAFRVTEAFQ